MNSKGASKPELQAALFAAIDPILGYLNYGNGSFDARFFQNLNVAFGLLGADTASQAKRSSLSPEALASDPQALNVDDSESDDESLTDEKSSTDEESQDSDPSTDQTNSNRTRTNPRSRYRIIRRCSSACWLHCVAIS